VIFDEKHDVTIHKIDASTIGRRGIKRQRSERQQLDDSQQRKQQGEALRKTIRQRL
jgi:hypothetical protein